MNGNWKCQDIQVYLMELWNLDQARFRMSTTGTLDWLLSDLNRQQFNYQTRVRPDGKTRELEVKYRQRLPLTDVEDTETTICNVTGTVTPLIDDYTINNYRQVSKVFTWEEMRLVCGESMETFVNGVLIDMMMALKRSVNNGVVDSLFTQFGQLYNGGGTSLDVDFSAPLSTTPIADILYEYEQSAYTGGKPAIIGSGELSKWMIQNKWMCCNDNGLNGATASEDMWYFKDNYLWSKLNGNAVPNATYALLEPQAAQFVQYNRYVGEFTRDTPTNTVGVLAMPGGSNNPLNNLIFDYEWYFDECTKTLKVALSINFDLWTQPTDAFDATDEFYQTNGTILLNEV